MADVTVAKASSFEDLAARFRHQRNRSRYLQTGGPVLCLGEPLPHLDGPAVQGRLLPCYEEDLDETGASKGRRFAKDKMNIVCPWHGFEFDIRTGVIRQIRRCD